MQREVLRRCSKIGAASAHSEKIEFTERASRRISRRGISTSGVVSGMSAHPQKQLSLSCVAREAQGWFGAAFIVLEAASALGGYEPSLTDAAISFDDCF